MLTMKDIHIRDPFVLKADGKYYMYGTRGADCWGKCMGFDVYVSSDLSAWSDPITVFEAPKDFWADRNFWAPEVHCYRGKYYMFASFKNAAVCRGTQILCADSPEGPFCLHSDGPVTPRDWECLDGTLYVDEDGQPYIVFCHEWTQVMDGEMCALRLSEDLARPIGDPIRLFCASEPAWAIVPDWARKGQKVYITDGPFLYRTKSGRLLMIWSSFAREGYCEALAYSDNGRIDGRWIHDERLLFSKDGGHGMIFESYDGELYFICHQPNTTPLERPCLTKLEEKDNTLIIKAT